MQPAHAALLGTTLGGSALLGASYVAARPSASDWGRVPAIYHTPMLVSAALAVLALVGVLLYFSMLGGDRRMTWVLVGAAVGFFALQLAFLPLVRAALRGAVPRWTVTALLAATVVPTLVVAYVAITSTTPSATRQWVRAVVVLASLFAALHTIVMDAVLFGILF
tara:strand:+ start:752 stop:1246 length:495 start_codon:yes stop_codon:yes gene_type:complete